MKLKDWLIPRPTATTGTPLAAAGIAPGLYHYVCEGTGAPARFHLRVDTTGAGLLVANAAAAAQLRPSGVIIAKAVLEGEGDPAIVLRLTSVFRGVSAEAASADVCRVRNLIARLQSPEDNYPILNLADPAFAPAAAPLDRPLSADVPLAEPKRLVPLVDRLWQLAIPHVTFIAGQNPDPRWLVRAVERAEDLGMIAGVRIRATELLGGTLAADLAAAGVDHVDVLYLSHEPAVHDALAGPGDHAAAIRALATVRDLDVCAVAGLALVEANLASIDETIAALVAQGVTNLALFAIAVPEEEHKKEDTTGAVAASTLVQAAALVEESAEAHGLRLLWYPPVRRDPTMTLADQIRRGPRASGDTAVRVEPDGAVIAARGPWQNAGNLLANDWDAIYSSAVYQAYRRRVETDTHCDTCPGLAICAADCPRDPTGWADDRKATTPES